MKGLQTLKVPMVLILSLETLMSPGMSILVVLTHVIFPHISTTFRYLALVALLVPEHCFHPKLFVQKY